MVMRRAFVEPTGLPGRLGAAYMARIGGRMHEWAIDVLDPQPGHHILEIGPAHGALIQRMANRVSDLQVTAIDPSPDMVKLASKRNRALADEGRLEVLEGRVSAIPAEEASFDGVISTHTIYFWPDLDADLVEVVRVMKPGGRVVIGFRAAQVEDGTWHVAITGGTDAPSPLSVVGLRERCAVAGLVNLRAQLRHFHGRNGRSFGLVVGDKRTA
jgi:SAM-dependent methyltransferase